ncbi:hypothetical protein FNV43_RR14862 [Rhamnella rubrinervis]|uniref:Uncharacterized protein n=1 Tax=Rhamnella rubrinervis TaxID=2594499 RepID=A0A8K0H449_9ROSA|nr:hypothetical protein FNV43_RR14862 [Rhamnella rubrinervis]
MAWWSILRSLVGFIRVLSGLVGLVGLHPGLGGHRPRLVRASSGLGQASSGLNSSRLGPTSRAWWACVTAWWAYVWVGSTSSGLGQPSQLVRASSGLVRLHLVLLGRNVTAWSISSGIGQALDLAVRRLLRPWWKPSGLVELHPGLVRRLAIRPYQGLVDFVWQSELPRGLSPTSSRLGGLNLAVRLPLGLSGASSGLVQAHQSLVRVHLAWSGAFLGRGAFLGVVRAWSGFGANYPAWSGFIPGLSGAVLAWARLHAGFDRPAWSRTVLFGPTSSVYSDLIRAWSVNLGLDFARAWSSSQNSCGDATSSRAWSGIVTGLVSFLQSLVRLHRAWSFIGLGVGLDLALDYPGLGQASLGLVELRSGLAEPSGLGQSFVAGVGAIRTRLELTVMASGASSGLVGLHSSLSDFVTAVGFIRAVRNFVCQAGQTSSSANWVELPWASWAARRLVGLPPVCRHRHGFVRASSGLSGSGFVTAWFDFIRHGQASSGGPTSSGLVRASSELGSSRLGWSGASSGLGRA